MRALILAGGYGTRLRPLTLSRPKPLVEFCNKPIIFHQIEALIDVGVDVIVLAVSYMCDMLKVTTDFFEKEKNVKIIYSKEDEPLGTAGPLALARKYFENEREPFFVFNSDVTCTFPLKQMYEFHASKNAETTIAVTKVDDPSKYGVVVFDEHGKVSKFVEKPKTFVSNKINAGIYVIDPKVLNRIELKPTSIENDVFPFIAEDGQLFAFELTGFWMDIGQPKDYLSGVNLYLNHLKNTHPHKLGTPSLDFQTCIIHSTSTIGEGCVLSNSVIGENVTIGEGVCLTNCVVLSESTVKPHTFIDRSIIGWKCVIGRWVRIEGFTILGEDVNVKDEVYIQGARVLPHKCIKDSLFTPEVVM